MASTLAGPSCSQVKRHSAANGWFDLATALHLEATDMLAPAVPAAPTPALPAAPLGASWGAAPGGAGAAMSPAPAVPTPGPPAVHLGRGGLGQWAGHTMPAQQMAGYQQGAPGCGLARWLAGCGLPKQARA